MSKIELTALIVAFCGLLLLGCQEEIKIVMLDPEGAAPTFGLQSAATDGADITAFWIADFKTAGHEREFAWRIESVDGIPKHVTKIKFGILPDGFREIGSRKPLIPGMKYEAGAGMAGRIGSLEFVSQ